MSFLSPFAPPRRAFSRWSRRLAAFSAGGLLLLGSARAGDTDSADNADGTSAELRADKNQYNLFNPTPDDLLRPFSSSRPDQTTGPHSVDAGHYYLETGLAYSLGLGMNRTDTWNYFQSTHVRLGLLNNVELELIWSGIDETRTRPLGSGGKRSDSDITGATDLTVRTRFVLVGNDSRTFAFSIDPEVILPTQSHHIDSEYVQGDIIFCFSFKLPLGFSTTINAQPSFVRNGSDTANEFGFVSGLTLYHNLFRKEDNVQLYLEYYDTLVAGPGSTDARQADIGVRWRPFKNLQFDAGCNFGVSADAPDYQPFVGVATRF